MGSSHKSWLDYMNGQLDFYNKGFRKTRVDDEFDWAWINSGKGKIPGVEPIVNLIRQRTALYAIQWFNENSELLWRTRQMLEDELSRYSFDVHLLVKILSYQKYYYPRIDFDDFILINREEDLINDLPKDYAGLKLKIYSIKLINKNTASELSIVTAKLGTGIRLG